MSTKFEIDDRDYQKLLDRLGKQFEAMEKKALTEMADTLLVLARHEVPFRDGDLAGSGNVDPAGDEVIVAFNIEYASYQHEGVRRDGTRRVQFHNDGRKTKYLEDPLKLNIKKWEQIAFDALASAIK